jgi:hypothetical protein
MATLRGFENFLEKKSLAFKKLFEDYLIRNNRVATKETLNSIKVEWNLEGITLQYSGVIDVLDKGINGINKNNGSPFSFKRGKKMINPDSILPWMRARGIPDAAKYPIARKIYLEGFRGDNELEGLIEIFINVFYQDLQIFLGIELENISLETLQ